MSTSGVDRLFRQHAAGAAVPWLDLRRSGTGLTAGGQALPEGTEATGDADGVTLTWKPSRGSSFTQRIERDGTSRYEHRGVVNQVRVTVHPDGHLDTLTRMGDDRPWGDDETSRIVDDGWVQIGERAKFKMIVDPALVAAQLRTPPPADLPAPERAPTVITMGLQEVAIGGVRLPLRA